MRIPEIAVWRRGGTIALSALLGLALLAPLAARSEPPLRFLDDFETDKGWGLFEEIVGGSSCYGAGVGEVARSTEAAAEGAFGLRVWANKLLSDKSNHLIAQKRISDTGQTGRFRYELSAFIAPETYAGGQTGPEFSMQNTREVSPGQFRTATAGIQYLASPYLNANPAKRNWAIWAEVAPGQAAWQPLLETDALRPGEWYSLQVEADYTTNRYVRFSLHGPGINLSRDLRDYRIAQEAKFTEQAFWLTLESENLYNNCGTAGIFTYKVYYDDLALRRIGP